MTGASGTHASWERALAAIRSAVAEAQTPAQAVQAAMQLIQAHLPRYEWVGVYVLRSEVLQLGPYVGAATEHTRIPVGVGVCGTAVAEGRNQVIADVRRVQNYLACSAGVRSEIVVMIHHEGRVVGQIDADCDAVGAFGAADEAFLTEVAALLAQQVVKL
jgi:L-methionine (R)-S-oxide reductase